MVNTNIKLQQFQSLHCTFWFVQKKKPKGRGKDPGREGGGEREREREWRGIKQINKTNQEPINSIKDTRQLNQNCGWQNDRT